MPFATVDWLELWPAFVDDLAASVRNLAPGVILRDAMVDVVPAMPIAPALPIVRVSPAEPSPASAVPSPVSGPSLTGTPGPSHTPSSGRGLSPQSGPGSDVDRASHPVRALPTWVSPHRLTPSSDAVPAAPFAPVSSSTEVPAGPPIVPASPPVAVLSAPASPVSTPSVVKIDPPAAGSQSTTDLKELSLGIKLGHACSGCSHWRQACRVSEGSDLSAKDLQCKRCVYYKEKCKWVSSSATGAPACHSLFCPANLFRLLGSKRVRTSARLSQRASRAAWETVPRLPSLVFISKKFPEELPEFPQDGTPQASLRELLTWHAELSRASYAYRELRASYDAAIVQAGLAAERLVAGDALCHKLWDHYLHLTGLHVSSDPSLSCSSSKGKDRALSISSDDEEQDTNDDDDDDDGGDGGDHWSGLSRSENNDRDAGAGGANAGAGAMDTS